MEEVAGTRYDEQLMKMLDSERKTPQPLGSGQ